MTMILPTSHKNKSSNNSNSNMLLLVTTIMTSMMVIATRRNNGAQAFTIPFPGRTSTSVKSPSTTRSSPATLFMADTIISPFDDSADNSKNNPYDDNTSAVATTKESIGDGPFELTWDNVEMVLDEMRPYLIQDGGNVAIQEIDGPVVKLELQGACGTCPSSTQTLKMGLERGLMEKIPEIQEVIQAMPEGPPLEEEQVDFVLDGVRPFLQVAGGSIECNKIEGEGGLQPTIWLEMKGNSASLNSVKLEIAQRLQKHFMMAGLHVEWVKS